MLHATVRTPLGLYSYLIVIDDSWSHDNGIDSLEACPAKMASLKPKRVHWVLVLVLERTHSTAIQDPN